MAFERPHMQWPIRRDKNGRIICVEEDSTENIRSQEWAVAVCPIGWRTERVDFGWPMPSLPTMPVDPQPLLDALDRLVPGPDRTAVSHGMLANDPSTWVNEIDSSETEQS